MTFFFFFLKRERLFLFGVYTFNLPWTAEFTFKAEWNTQEELWWHGAHSWGHHVASLLVQYSIYKSHVHAL